MSSFLTNFTKIVFKSDTFQARKHSSRMRATRLPTVGMVVASSWGGGHTPLWTCPPPWTYPPFCGHTNLPGHIHPQIYPHPGHVCNHPRKDMGAGIPIPKRDLVPVIPSQVDRMTDTCENITFPQLVLQAVIRKKASCIDEKCYRVLNLLKIFPLN